jgi:hypothetical protein
MLIVRRAIVERLRELEMLFISKAVDKHFPRKETVLLRFNKSDSQIARNWLESKTNDMFDDKN